MYRRDGREEYLTCDGRDRCKRSTSFASPPPTRRMVTEALAALVILGTGLALLRSVRRSRWVAMVLLPVAAIGLTLAAIRRAAERQFRNAVIDAAVDATEHEDVTGAQFDVRERTRSPIDAGHAERATVGRGAVVYSLAPQPGSMPLPLDHPAVLATVVEATERIDRLLHTGGATQPDVFHRELGRILALQCGVTRSAEHLTAAITENRTLREGFWNDVNVIGDGEHVNTRSWSVPGGSPTSSTSEN